MRRLAIVFIILLSLNFVSAQQSKTLRFPDIPGYLTLRCDFHMHTVFSDGLVWPSVRIYEAERESLDAIAITDHIEYRPNKETVVGNHNASFDIASKENQNNLVLLARGAEITRKMPPGHLNAIFTTDNSLLDNDDWITSVENATAQGSLIVWNHPGWMQEGENPIWYNEHSDLLRKGQMHAIEIVNGDSYYPAAHQWSIDSNLAILGCSDLHLPVDQRYNISSGQLRSSTLVFAKTKSLESIKEAILDKRTAVCYNNQVLGNETFLAQMIDSIIVFNSSTLNSIEGNTYVFEVGNNSPVAVDCTFLKEGSTVEGTADFVIAPGKVVQITLEMNQIAKEQKVTYIVNNFIIAPEKPLKKTFILKLPKEAN